MKKLLFLCAAALFFLCPFPVWGGGDLEMHVIDVGQGEAILLSTPGGSHLLIDAGNLSAGHRVRQYLKNRKIAVLDAVIITHMHPDHVGGLFALAPDLTIKMLYDHGDIRKDDVFGNQYIRLANHLGVQRTVLGAGDALSFGRVEMQVLSPARPPAGDMNADSIVLKISYEKVSFLLAADLNAAGEKRLLGKKLDLRSHVLKVGHHGANDATSESFLEAVRPLHAVISAGTDNPLLYPGEGTLELLKRAKVNVMRTDRDGTIIVRTDGHSLSIERE